jgi:hypothetical protein
MVRRGLRFESGRGLLPLSRDFGPLPLSASICWLPDSAPNAQKSLTGDTRHMKNRGASLVWITAVVGLAVAFVIVTFVGSVLNSCGAGNYGPNTGAEAEFCGYGSGEPTDYSALFVFVQLIPAIPVLVGGLLPALGRSWVFFPAGLGLGVFATGLIWALEP